MLNNSNQTPSSTEKYEAFGKSNSHYQGVTCSCEFDLPKASY